MFYPAIVLMIVEVGALAFLIWAWFAAKKHPFRKEWNITYSIHDGEGGRNEFFVILPSFWKVLWWFATRGRKACEIYIWTSGMRIDEEDGDPFA